MSTIQTTPFIKKVIGTLTTAQKSALVALMNGGTATPTFKSLINPANFIAAAFKGVNHIVLETQDRKFTGYLIYNDTYCVMVAYVQNSQELTILKIDLENQKYEIIPEELSILEFRMLSEDPSFEDSDFEGSVTIGDDLTVTDDASIGGDLGVTGNATVGGNLVVDGKISGGEIVEDMEGYSFGKGTNDGYTVTPKYVGAVKNGNKLTLTFFGSVRRTSESPQYNFIDLGAFTLPNDVFAKLVSYPIGSGANQYLDNRNLALFASNLISVTKPATILKLTDTIEMYIYSANDLSTSNTYLVRYEATFLLSENLAA